MSLMSIMSAGIQISLSGAPLMASARWHAAPVRSRDDGSVASVDRGDTLSNEVPESSI
jgi:hypothetical protein